MYIYIYIFIYIYIYTYLLYKYNPGVWGHFETTLPHGVAPPRRSFYCRKYHMSGMKYNIYGGNYDVYDLKSLKYRFEHINYDEKYMPELFLTPLEPQNTKKYRRPFAVPRSRIGFLVILWSRNPQRKKRTTGQESKRDHWTEERGPSGILQRRRIPRAREKEAERNPEGGERSQRKRRNQRKQREEDKEKRK